MEASMEKLASGGEPRKRLLRHTGFLSRVYVKYAGLIDEYEFVVRKSCAPIWELIDYVEAENFPAPWWKLANIRKL